MGALSNVLGLTISAEDQIGYAKQSRRRYSSLTEVQLNLYNYSGEIPPPPPPPSVLPAYKEWVSLGCYRYARNGTRCGCSALTLL